MEAEGQTGRNQLDEMPEHQIFELLKKYRPNLLEQYEKSIDRKEIKYLCESIEAIAARDGSVIFCIFI